jgi:hypothetical protein
MSKILFGSDPECAAMYTGKDGNSYALPPYFFRKNLGVQASDDEKHPVFMEGDGWKAHEDGANFEFSIHPSHDPLELFQRIQEAANSVSQTILQPWGEYCQPTLQFLPSVNWESSRWENMPEDFFMSTTFGCDPDRDVYDFQAEPRMEDARTHPWRYCGGHIHVSGSSKIMVDPLMAVKCMVISAGLAATAFSDVPDLERQRVYRYGRPGKFRVQNYGPDNPFGPEYAIGIEYRTVSARWAGNWEIAQKVLHWAELGITTLFETSLGEEIHGEIYQPSIQAIVTADQELAQELLGFVESKL